MTMKEEEGPLDYARPGIIREVIRERSESDDGNGSKFNGFVYAVFVAVVMGSGWIIWNLVSQNSALDKRVSLLEWKCPNQPLSRGP